MNEANEKSKLHRALGYRDVVMLLITCCVNLQWVATAAGAGPTAIFFWILAFLSMTVPLGAAVLEMSSRYPEEGGIYVWSKKTFGEFSGFMTGWIYWMSNLPYFPGVLYFAAANILFMGGSRWLHLSDSRAYFLWTSLAILTLATWVNVVGLEFGKWLNNAGAIARWIAALGLIVMGGMALSRFGSATSFAIGGLIPAASIKHLIFWSTVAFAVTGLEAASFMGEEIRDATRTIRRAIYTATPIIILIYILGTVSVLVALPSSEITNMQGVMEAIASVGDRLGIPGIAPIAAFIVALSALGSVGAWLGASARLPFVAGIDRYLPPSFGRVHPKWGTPHIALITQSVITLLCVVLSQAGSTVKSAYELLISMAVISYLIPYLYLFAAVIKVQRVPAPPGVYRVPGGRIVAILLACLGIASTSTAIVLALFPAEDDPNPTRSSAKLVILTLLLVGSGVLVYWRENRQRTRRAASGRGPAAGS